MNPVDQRCPRCQYPVAPGASSCPNCGLAFSATPPSPYGTDPLMPPPPPYSPPSSNPYGPPPGTSSAYGGSSYGGSPGYDYTPQPPSYSGSPSYYPGSQPPSFPNSAPAYPGSQPQGGGVFAPPGLAQPPVQQKKGNGLKIGLIILAVLIVLGGGGGVAAYFLTRPKPVITVTSDYKVGSTFAGSTSTVFHVTGQKFSGGSAITFLLDDKPAPDSQTVVSNSDGSVRADLTVGDGWTIGQHHLTAKDANNYTTQASEPLVVVSQGEAGTPGPKGSPTDSGTFNVKLKVTRHDVATGDQLDPFNFSLAIQGQPATADQQVCNIDRDDGQSHSFTGTDNIGPYTETYVWKCTGSYKGGKLSYTETATSDKLVYASGRTCTGQTPYTFTKLDGAFTAATAINGNYSGDQIEYTCNTGGNLHVDAEQGTWTGSSS